MATKRRHRRKYTWMPTLGTTGASTETTDDDLFGQHFTLAVPSDGTQAMAILPVVPDEPHDPAVGLAAQTSTLEDFIGNEWMLERIVGKLDWTACLDITLAGGDILVPNFDLAAGFFVSRADHSTPNFPIGEAADLTADYSPLNAHTVREPWLWHRFWSGSFVTNQAGVVPVANRAHPVGNTGAAQNFTLPNVNNGNLIDTASVRKIGQDDRLYFAMAAQHNKWGFTGATPTLSPQVFCSLFVRVLGRLMRARGDGKF